LDTVSKSGTYDARAALAEADFCAFFASLPEAEIVDTPHFLRVRTTVPLAYANPIVCRQFPGGDVLDALIEETRAYYAAHGSPCEWFLTPHTTPADLGRILVAHGLVYRSALPLMATDLATLPETVTIPEGCTIEEVCSQEQWAEWCRTCTAGSGFAASIADPLLAALSMLPSGPETALRHYLARLDGTAVATATLFLGGGTAGIYYVATLPEARGRGIGAAVTLAALREGQASGEQVGVLQSSPMGYSVYRRLGFVECCVWDCYGEAAPDD